MEIAEREEIRQETSPIRFSPRQKVLVVGGIIGLAAVLLFVVRGIVTTFIWAMIAAYLLDPIVAWLSTRSRLKRVYIVGAIYVVFLGATAGFLMYLSPIISNEIRTLGNDYPTIISSAFKNVAGSESITVFGERVDAEAIIQLISRTSRDLPSSAMMVARRTADSLARVFIFLVATFLLLRDAPTIGQSARRLIPPPYREEIVGLVRRIHKVLGAYIRGQLFLIVFMSTVSWIVLGPIMHLRFAIVVSITTGVLELFPIIGPIVAGAIACTIGLFQDNSFGWPSWTYAAVLAGIYLVLRHTEDYLVIPNVIGRVVNLHPLVILFALFSGAAIGGVLGMFLAVPVTAALKLIGEYLLEKLVRD